MRPTAERDWQRWSGEAVALMQERNRAFVDTFDLAGRPFQWNLDAAQIAFLAGDDAVVADLCVVGSVSAIVAIREFRFVPDTIRVPAGTVITWINCEEDFADEPHTTTSVQEAWRSDLLSPGDLYQRRFDQPGTFPYFCEPHPFMTATVIVE